MQIRYMIFIVFFMLSCKKDSSKLQEIEYYSGIQIPNESKIMVYNDTDFEFEILFKIKIQKEYVDDFIKVNNFKRIDSFKTYNSNVMIDLRSVKEVESNFKPKELILNKNIKIVRTKNGILIIDCDSYFLWGFLGCYLDRAGMTQSESQHKR